MRTHSSYGDHVAAWKIELVVRRAKRLGFRKDEIDDVLQELVLDLIEFQFNPEHHAGASERTALSALVNHRLLNLRRSRNRRAEQFDRFVAAKTEEDLAYEQRDALIHDVRTTVESLSPVEQAICHGLAGGKSVRELATELDISWHQVQRAIDVVRDCFAARGMEKWIAASPAQPGCERQVA